MGFKKSRNCAEIWGARQCWYEYEYDPAPGEVYDILYKKIENFELDHIPDELWITAVNCLDPECERYEEKEFVIDPRDYLTNEELEDLERFLDIVYPPEEDENDENKKEEV